MSTSIIIEAPGGPSQSALTLEYTSTTHPVAVFTGSSLTHPVYTGPTATAQVPEYTGPASTSGSSSSGLSVGVKAGVGVGVASGVLVLAGLLWFAYTLGKRRSRAAPSDPPMYDSVVHEEGKQSKETLYSVDSIKRVEKALATEKAQGGNKPYVSDPKV
ncbi:hypothetical protein E8E11_004012 [Didymella keratinophila]|nr:hypothetical protein E8E11_004012 [Didymella keratinophila]